MLPSTQAQGKTRSKASARDKWLQQRDDKLMTAQATLTKLLTATQESLQSHLQSLLKLKEHNLAKGNIEASVKPYVTRANTIYDCLSIVLSTDSDAEENGPVNVIPWGIPPAQGPGVPGGGNSNKSQNGPPTQIWERWWWGGPLN